MTARPTHDEEADPGDFINGKTPHTLRIERLEERIHRRHRRVVGGVWALIASVAAAIAGAAITLDQLGIFSAQHGWAWVSKTDAKAESERVDQRFDDLEKKIDDLPAKLTETMRRHGRR